MIQSRARKRSEPAQAKVAASRPGRTAAKSDDAAYLLSFRWTDVYLEKANAAGLAKGQRTLLRLKAGAAQALEDIPYQVLRVADIVQRAEVSYGLFYHYFKDKEEIALDVLTELMAHVEALYRDIHVQEDDYESLFLPNLFYLDVYSRNAGLMRACLTLSEEVESFRTIWNESIDRWHRRIANAIRSHQSDGDLLLPDAELVAYGVGGMIDQICRQVYVQQNPYVSRLVTDTLQLAEAISILWFRAVYSRDPTAAQVSSCRAKYAAEAAAIRAPRRP